MKAFLRTAAAYSNKSLLLLKDQSYGSEVNDKARQSPELENDARIRIIRHRQMNNDLP